MKYIFAAATLLAAICAIIASPVLEAQDASETGEVTQGTLKAITKEGKEAEFPLKHTEVKAEISGFLARVEVTQTFQNPYTEKIEAVYVFPLPQNAAVDDMLMKIGERTIRGLIKA